MSSGGTTGIATWRDARWRAAALEWATGRLASSGLEPAGEAEQPHVRIWSTVFRLPLHGGGAAWLKSVGPGSAQEPPLAAALGGWVPDRVLVPLAVEPVRRLLLLPDGGATLRESRASLASWEEMLRAYARLQLDLVPHADGMLALEVPDTRPEHLPGLVDDLRPTRQHSSWAAPAAWTALFSGACSPGATSLPAPVSPSPTAASRPPCSTTTCTTGTCS